MDKKEFSLYNLYKIFILKKKFIVLSFVLLLILLVIYSFIMPHKYMAESSIMPSSSKSGGVGLASMLSDVSSSFSLGGLGGDDKSLLFSEIVTSRSVVNYIINKNNLENNRYFKTQHHQELVDYIRRSIVTDITKSGITTVGFVQSTSWFPSKKESDSIAVLSAKISQSAVEGLDSVLSSQSMSSAKQSRIYVDKQIKSYSVKLDSLEVEIQKFQEKNNVLEITEQTTAIANQGLEIAKELSVSELEYNLAKQIYAENAPQLKSYEKTYDVLKEQYEKSQKGGLVPTDKFTLPLDSIPELIRVYYDLMRKREIMEHVILYLQTQFFQEAIQESKDITQVEILDNAVVPYKRVSPVRSTMVIIGSIFILILILIYVTIVAFIKGNLYLKQVTDMKE